MFSKSTADLYTICSYLLKARLPAIVLAAVRHRACLECHRSDTGDTLLRVSISAGIDSMLGYYVRLSDRMLAVVVDDAGDDSMLHMATRNQ
jgi:hypothetical protein